MMKKFESRRAVEAALYILHAVKDCDLPRLAALLYLADKAHLAEHGAQMFGERYVRYPTQAWPQQLYGALTDPASLQTAFYFSPKRVMPRRDCELSRLSPAMIQCLNQVIGTYGDLTLRTLLLESIDRAWASTPLYEEIPVQLIVQTLPNSDEVLEHLGR